MANEKHLYLTIQGGYKSAPQSAEVFQTGLRLALVFGTIDSIGTLPNNWEPQSNPHTDTGTGWTGSTNWVAHHNLGDDFDPLDFLSQQVLPAVTAWFAQTAIYNDAYVQNLRLYPIGDTGHAVPAPPYAAGSPAILTTTSNTLIDGGGSGLLLPLQNTVVVSLRTQQVGPKGRGRMFQPCLDGAALTSSSNAAVSPTARTAIATAAVTLMQDLTWVAGIGTAQTAPIITGSPWNAYAKVSEVRVDSVVDTQRRRRNGIVPVVTSLPV